MLVRINNAKVLNNLVTLTNIIAASVSKGKEPTEIVKVDVSKKKDDKKEEKK